MGFEEGKYYRHTTGEMLHVVAYTEATTLYLAPCLIAERDTGQLVALGVGSEYAVNWTEVQQSEWEEHIALSENS